MEQYSAINIGPIISTLGMARKPHELWGASYLFSHLMKCIYQVAEREDVAIISPSKPSEANIGVGIYPDRIFIKGSCDLNEIMRGALDIFYKDLGNPDLTYFNLMASSCEAEKESEAIGILNKKLDVLELCKYAPEGDAADTIYNIISQREDSKLLEIATGRKYFSFKDFESIARIRLDVDKNASLKSHHKYICIVQADGDNIGSTVSNAGLKDGEVLKISKELVQFGEMSTQLIRDYGGLPIYAGGDDLLFIAPVIGKDGSNIFNLLDNLDSKAFKGVHDLVGNLGLTNKEGKKIEASLSFGLSISYHKYPLYEALETARKLLFEKAKKEKQKNAVAWKLRKHSGGSFDAIISRKNNDLWDSFMSLILNTEDEETVSAVAHKIRQEETLVKIVLESENNERIDALFHKILEYDESKDGYFDAVKKIMPLLFKTSKGDDLSQTLYSMLRTAKFIKGEDLRDE